MSIVTVQEIDDLYGLPRFVRADRDHFFQLSGPELAAVASIRTVSVAAHLKLELGYNKVKRQFFAYKREETAEGLGHVLNLYFPGKDLGVIKRSRCPFELNCTRQSSSF